MNTRSIVVMGFLGMAALVTACSATTEDPIARPEEGSVGPNAKKSSPQLNLSHIECLEDGTVNAHFVLLHYTGGNPGPITGASNQGPFSAPAGKNTGNVWHYNVSLSAGAIEILSATAAGTSLHNPGEYSGNYFCGGDDPECPVTVQEGNFCANPSDLGNPGAECAYLGLDWTSAKDETGGSTATETAYVAIVKGGSNGPDGVCAQGETSYNVYVNVVDGQTALETGNGSDISHVTYCKCPAAE
jgi:hypothetical protein